MYRECNWTPHQTLFFKMQSDRVVENLGPDCTGNATRPINQISCVALVLIRRYPRWAPSQASKIIWKTFYLYQTGKTWQREKVRGGSRYSGNENWCWENFPWRNNTTPTAGQCPSVSNDWKINSIFCSSLLFLPISFSVRHAQEKCCCRKLSVMDWREKWSESVRYNLTRCLMKNFKHFPWFSN